MVVTQLQGLAKPSNVSVSVALEHPPAGGASTPGRRKTLLGSPKKPKTTRAQSTSVQKNMTEVLDGWPDEALVFDLPDDYEKQRDAEPPKVPSLVVKVLAKRTISTSTLGERKFALIDELERGVPKLVDALYMDGHSAEDSKGKRIHVSLDVTYEQA